MPEQQPYVDAVSMSDAEAHVYEAIAVVETTGEPVTRARIHTAAMLDEPAVDEALAALADRGAIARDGDGEDATYALAEHGWAGSGEDRGAASP